MVRERLPRATIITFWPSPGPNPDAFGISSLARGMLSKSYLGSASAAAHRSSTAQLLTTRGLFLERASTARLLYSPTAQTTYVSRYRISTSGTRLRALAGFSATGDHAARAFR